MKSAPFVALLFVLSLKAFANDRKISGTIYSSVACSRKVMVWLSLDKGDYKDRLLLLHTEVPSKGTFRFYVKPGDYQIRATDEAGCEFLQKVSLKGKDLDLSVRMAKK